MNRDEETLKLYQAEYNNLKREIEQRITGQNQTFNFVAIILAATASIIGTIMSSSSTTFPTDASKFDLIALLIALLPVAIAPLAFMFFDNELMIFGIGSYIYEDLRRRVENVLGYTEEEFFLGDARVLKNMLVWSPSAQLVLSTGRWLLFIALTIVPTIYVMLSIDHFKEPMLWWLILTVDSIISLVVTVAMIATLREQLRWRLEHPYRWSIMNTLLKERRKP
ncbi:MAG TPA: hypothetical protein VF952_06440 [Chloroflexia bacterium]|jgi:hypothetical protein